MKQKKLILSILLLITLGVSSFSATSYAIKDNDTTTGISSRDTILSLKKDYKISDLSGLRMETERLVITPTNEGELDTLAEYLLDKEVTQWLDPTTADGFETKEKALKFLKSDSSGEYSGSLEYTIKLKDSDTPIGKLDLMLFSDLLGKNSQLSIGYWLGKDFQGKGYMKEACFEFCIKAFNASDIKSLHVYCDVENKKSCGLIDKIFDYIEENSTTELFRKKETGDEKGTIEGKDISFGYCHFALSKDEI